ncbi:MAG: 3,4-dihydroxy-2-butanone-4-phosphate synthase, partial [Xanthomonadales bacterium]|nr:3,4-dihydroxy-2-butanone-4-phosphate synthase [Xanthomonadales bacterium]
NALTAKLSGSGVSPKELRQYGVGAQILAALGVTEMEMLTNSPAPKVVGLEGYGITIIGTRPIPKRGG